MNGNENASNNGYGECEASPQRVIPPFCLLLFGGAGDMSKRMLLPALYHLFKEENLIREFAVIGIGKPDFTDEQYRAFAK